jgi:anti-anti-sigma regulatory factor
MKWKNYNIQGSFADMRALEIKEELLSIASNPDTNLMIDVSEIQQVDIGALNAIMMTYKKIHNNHGQLRMRLIKDSVLDELFHITKFNKYVNLEYV